MYAKKRSVSMKVVVLLLAVVLLIGCVAGSTLAFLMTKTNQVKNTFVAGNIGTLTLYETDEKGNTVYEREFIVVPGKDITKDPVVKFTGYNVDAYVFLKVDASGWSTEEGTDGTTYYVGTDSTDKKMHWVLAGWKKLESGVYYKEVGEDDGNKTWAVIQDNTITVSSEITMADINSYAKELNFTAYAIQQAGFGTVAAAWTEAQKAGN